MLHLASTSPRRKEILEFFSVPFTQLSPPFDESTYPFKGDPKAYVKELSKLKALSARDQYPDELIIAADTIVVFENRPIEKPASKMEAISMLERLSGNWHSVISAITGVKGEHVITDYDQTDVLFKDLSISEINKYIDALNPLDKAGAYAIQGAGNIIVEELKGCFYNVMGLPINTLERILKTLGLSLWDYLENQKMDGAKSIDG